MTSGLVDSAVRRTRIHDLLILNRDTAERAVACEHRGRVALLAFRRFRGPYPFRPQCWDEREARHSERRRAQPQILLLEAFV